MEHWDESRKEWAMKWFFRSCVAASCFVLLSVESGCTTEKPNTIVQGAQFLIQKENLDLCINEELGVKFHCDKNWKIQTVDNAVLIIISSEPSVTLTIAKIDEETKFLGQLTNASLKEKQLYADGFQTERVEFAHHDALQVKAYSIQDVNRRVNDYFFIHRRALYGVLFSVEPKEKWNDYQALIKQIYQNFQLVD